MISASTHNLRSGSFSNSKHVTFSNNIRSRIMFLSNIKLIHHIRTALFQNVTLYSIFFILKLWPIENFQILLVEI